MRNYIIFSTALLAVIGFLFWPNAHNPDYYDRVGTFAPEQVLINTESIDHKGYKVAPVSTFDLKARVLSAERYRLGSGANLSPLDLALGWGPMAEDENLDKIKIWQRGRFYFWQTNNFPIPRREIEVNSANMHLIPASDEIEAEMLTAKKGDIILLSGNLVNVSNNDGYQWNTSTTRGDTGSGACEIVYVKSFVIEK